MKILLIQAIRNEISMLPWKYRYCQENEIDIFTFDNFSTDGSWEWLQENKHPCERLNTEGLFSLKWNNTAIKEKFQEVQPDWCIVAGCDMFYYASNFKTLRRFIEYVDALGFDIIDCSRLFNFYYTGTEDDSKDPRREYFFYQEQKDWTIHLIARYHPIMYIDGDKIQRPGNIFVYPNLACFHYWFRSDAEQRFADKLVRRMRSWDRGTDSVDHGGHYQGIVDRKEWVWDPAGLKDVREGIFGEVLSLK